MSAFSRCLQSAREQIALVAPESSLNRSYLLARCAAVATLAMAGATAHAWNDPQQQGPLPERQATRWGENIGTAVGRMVGSSAIGNPTNPAARAVQSAVIGIGEDVGRWAGGRAAAKPYERGPADLANVANGIAPADRDHLDTLGLRTIFAAEELARTPSNSRDYRVKGDSLYQAQRNFEMAYRAAAERRVDTSPWAELREALTQAHRSFQEVRMAELGRPLAERLNRPGGPGFDRNAQLGQVNPLAQLRRQAMGGSSQETMGTPAPMN